MTSSSSLIHSPVLSPPSSTYMSARTSQQSCQSHEALSHLEGTRPSGLSDGGQSTPPRSSSRNKNLTKSQMRTFGSPGVQRTPRTSFRHTTSRFCPHPPKLRTTRPQPEVFVVANDIPRQPFPSPGDYALAETQKSLNAARNTKDELRAKERRSLLQLGEGNLHIRALEAEVLGIRFQLGVADHRIEAIQQELLLKGVVVDDRGFWAYATSEDLRRTQSPFVRAHSLTGFMYETSSAVSSMSQGSYDVRSHAPSEPMAKVDIFQWSRATLPGEDLESPFSAADGTSVDSFMPTHGSIDWAR